MFNFFRKKPQIDYKALNEFLATFYNGAQLGEKSFNYANADADFEEFSADERAELRRRAKWHSANDGISANIDANIIASTVGNGIKIQFRVPEHLFTPKKQREINNRIEDYIENAFDRLEISGRFNSAMQIEAALMKTLIVEGECFAQIIHTKDRRYPTKIALYEPHRIADGAFKREPNIVDGLEVDETGRVLNYYFNDGQYRNETKKIPADKVLHLIERDYPSQYRGVTHYAQSILNLRNLSGYIDAALIGARTRKSISFAVKNSANGAPKGGIIGRGKETPLAPSYPVQKIVAGMVHYLNAGEEIQTLAAPDVGNEFDPFVKTALRLIAAGRRFSYEFAFSDFSQTNFTSGRMGENKDWRILSMYKARITEQVLRPIVRQLLDDAIKTGIVDLPNYFNNPDAYFYPRFIYPIRQYINPVDEVNAERAALEMGLTSKTALAAARGREFEEIAYEIQKEKELEERLGIARKEKEQ